MYYTRVKIEGARSNIHTAITLVEVNRETLSKCVLNTERHLIVEFIVNYKMHCRNLAFESWMPATRRSEPVITRLAAIFHWLDTTRKRVAVIMIIWNFSCTIFMVFVNRIHFSSFSLLQRFLFCVVVSVSSSTTKHGSETNATNRIPYLRHRNIGTYLRLLE